MKTATKRVRPEDGGIVWHEEWNAFECYGCGEFEEIRKRADRTPEKLAELREMLVADHTECWEFDDSRMAAEARKYRKEKKRRENLRSRDQGSGNRDQNRQPLDCSGYIRGLAGR
jgi:hypothetical protein